MLAAWLWIQTLRPFSSSVSDPVLLSGSGSKRLDLEGSSIDPLFFVFNRLVTAPMDAT